MRILYHHRTRAEDAQGIHIREIIRSMTLLGHEVRIAALVDPAESARSAPSPEKDGEGRSSLAYELMTLAYNVYGFFMIAGRILRFRPGMIYERYSLNTFCGVLAARAFGIPIVLEVNAPLSYENKKYGNMSFPGLASRMERRICGSADATIVVSGVMKDMLREIGVPPEKMTVLPNGINPEEFNPGIPGDAIRDRYGLRGKTVLGFAGWFRKWHGLEPLIRLFASEGWGKNGNHLLLIGDGPARAEMESRIRELGQERFVTITGPVPREEMPSHIAALDVALQPSVTEYASPMKIFEYMGMGKCIVAPRQPNIEEILDDGRTALLFEPGSDGEMAAALRAALTDGELRSTLGKNAADAVMDRRFLWTANAERAISLAIGATSRKGG